MYHEHQSLALCALHSLNNLFQGTAFSKTHLDDICKRLSPDSGLWNPHKSCVGLGNYDVNVIMAALESKDCSAVWFDRRKDPRIIDVTKIVGFILNIPSEPKFGPIRIPFIRRKHWIAVREIEGTYYNLDSKLDYPEVIGDEQALVSFLRETLQCREKELFIVVSKNIEQDSSWVKNDQHPVSVIPPS